MFLSEKVSEMVLSFSPINFSTPMFQQTTGAPSGALDSRQNVRFPPVECSVVSARSNSNGPIRVDSETTLRAAVAASSSQASEESQRGEF